MVASRKRVISRMMEAWSLFYHHHFSQKECLLCYAPLTMSTAAREPFWSDWSQYRDTRVRLDHLICSSCWGQLDLRRAEAVMFETLPVDDAIKSIQANLSVGSTDIEADQGLDHSLVTSVRCASSDRLVPSDHLSYLKPTWGVCASPYMPPFDQMIRLLKFHDGVQYAPFLGRILFEAYQSARHLLPSYPDFICPIPLHLNRQRERGYNQAELIMRYMLACGLDLQARMDCLIRIKKTKRQSELQDPMLRLDNVHDAFYVPSKAIKFVMDQHILLIDDVWTTGSTFFAAAKALYNAGAQLVTPLMLCKVKPHSNM